MQIELRQQVKKIYTSHAHAGILDAFWMNSLRQQGMSNSQCTQLFKILARHRQYTY